MKVNRAASWMLSAAALAIAPTAANAVAGDPGPAPATNVLNTSPLYADNGQSYHACNVWNVTAGNVPVKVDVLNTAGTAIATSGATLITLAPGEFREFAAGNYSGFARCRITVGGNPANIRANLTVFHSTGTFYDSLAVSEAR